MAWLRYWKQLVFLYSIDADANENHSYATKSLGTTSSGENLIKLVVRGNRGN